MKQDALKQFVTLRINLTAEKARLERRLHEINTALGTNADEVPTQIQRQSTPGRKPRVTRQAVRSGITLKEAVTKLTSAKPLTKKEIVAGLKSTGYKTKSKNPGNLLNRIFYGKNAAFTNVGDGKYAPR